MNTYSGATSHYRRSHPRIIADLPALLDQAASDGSPRSPLNVDFAPGPLPQTLVPHFDDLFTAHSEDRPWT